MSLRKPKKFIVAISHQDAELGGEGRVHKRYHSETKVYPKKKYIYWKSSSQLFLFHSNPEFGGRAHSTSTSKFRLFYLSVSAQLVLFFYSFCSFFLFPFFVSSCYFFLCFFVLFLCIYICVIIFFLLFLLEKCNWLLARCRHSLITGF